MRGRAETPIRIIFLFYRGSGFGYLSLCTPHGDGCPFAVRFAALESGVTTAHFEVDATVVLAINGGSSSIKVAMFRAGSEPVRLLSGGVERIGSKDAELRLKDAATGSVESAPIGALGHAESAGLMVAKLKERIGARRVLGIGHRIVFGGPGSPDHQLVAPGIMSELRGVAKMDSTHLPREIALVEVFERAFAGVPQALCLDTAFHRGLPHLSTLLPIPRRFRAAGIRRYGYHGLSYEFLVSELEREEGARPEARVVFAHLGSGASMAAVRGGKPIDTTMATSALSGLMMGTRPGDLDPGVVLYMAMIEKLAPDRLASLLNRECGLLGVSGISADVRDLLARRAHEANAAEAIDLFCWIARKHLAAMAASLGGIDTLVFSGGIGENSPEIRSGICRDMAFLGVEIDDAANRAGSGVISGAGSRVAVRVVRTDEELMIARHVIRLVSRRTTGQ